MSGRSSRSTLTLTNSSFITAAVSGSSKRLVRHHVAPVARGVADRQQHRPVLVARPVEGLVAPGVPVHRVLGVLAEVEARLARETIHPAEHRPGPSDGRPLPFVAWSIRSSPPPAPRRRGAPRAAGARSRCSRRRRRRRHAARGHRPRRRPARPGPPRRGRGRPGARRPGRPLGALVGGAGRRPVAGAAGLRAALDAARAAPAEGPDAREVVAAPRGPRRTSSTALAGGPDAGARFALLGHRARPERRMLLGGRSSSAFLVDPGWDDLRLVRLAPSEGPSLGNRAHMSLLEVIAAVRRGEAGPGLGRRGRRAPGAGARGDAGRASARTRRSATGAW